MSYSTRAEVRDMVKDDALNAIIGDTFIEDPAEREELVSSRPRRGVWIEICWTRSSTRTPSVTPHTGRVD